MRALCRVAFRASSSRSASLGSQAKSRAAWGSRATGAATLALCLAASGCAHVHPYEREYHSKPHMTPADERAETAFQAHLRESREGATSGSSAAGGGCGCN